MRTSKNNPSPIIVLFWSTPSCSMLKAYKEKSDRLSQAVKESRKVELVTDEDKVLKLNNLGLEAGKFFGLKGIKGEMKKMILNIHRIKMVTLL